MSNPVTAMMGGGAIGQIIGGYIGAQGAQVQAQAQANSDIFQSEESQYQAGVANYNKQVADSNADYARNAGEVEAQQAGTQVRADIGNIRAQQGAGGLDVNTGTNVNVRMSQLEVGQENVALLRGNAARVAYGYDVQAYQFGQQATWDTTASSYYQQAASWAKTAGDINAEASILGGYSKAAASFASMAKAT